MVIYKFYILILIFFILQFVIFKSCHKWIHFPCYKNVVIFRKCLYCLLASWKVYVQQILKDQIKIFFVNYCLRNKNPQRSCTIFIALSQWSLFLYIVVHWLRCSTTRITDRLDLIIILILIFIWLIYLFSWRRRKILWFKFENFIELSTEDWLNL